MKDVMILVGAGQIGMAIARRMGFGMKIIVGD
jgi:lactate dehydrogenase-like 2-hydroxyacid dehydrogenase